MIDADLLITDCHVAAMSEGGEPYGAIEDAAILIKDGRIAWVGPRADLPVHQAVETHRLGGRWVTPGLIDCHTHLLFRGDRSCEFERRLEGAPYEALARAGGAIVASVPAPRQDSEEQLHASALPRL